MGQIVMDATGNVVMTIHTGTGTLSGQDTIGFAAGVAPFSDLAIDTAGAVVLRATYGALTVDSASFTVSDPDAVDFFARVITNSGTISAPIQTAANTMFGSLKTASLWSKIVDMAVFMGDFNAFPVKMKFPGGVASVLVNSGFVSGQFNQFTGLVADGGNDLDTGVVPNAHGMTATDQSVAVYFSNPGQISGGTNINIGAGSIFFMWSNLKQYQMSGGSASGAGQTERLNVLTTDGSNIVSYGAGGAVDKSVSGGSSDAAASIHIFSYGGSFVASGTAIQGYVLANGLSATDVTNLSGILDAFMAARIASSRAGIGFFGDSITFGTGASDTAHDYASLVSAAMSLTQLNAGISGTVLQSINKKVSGSDGRTSSYQRLSVLRPSKIHIQYGVNDINQTVAGGYTIALYQAQLVETVNILIATTGLTANDICIGSPSWFTAFAGDGDRTRADAYAAAALAASVTAGTRFADCYAAIRDGGGAGLLADGLHPNDAGHAVLASTIEAAFA